MRYEVGKRVTGVINNITDLGIFLTLPGHKTGLIHHNDFSGDWLRERNQHRVGDRLRVVVIHNYKGKLGLSLSRVNDPELIDRSNQFSKTKAADFTKTLNQLAADSKKEIADLRKVLTEN